MTAQIVWSAFTRKGTLGCWEVKYRAPVIVGGNIKPFDGDTTLDR